MDLLTHTVLTLYSYALFIPSQRGPKPLMDQMERESMAGVSAWLAPPDMILPSL